MNLEEAISLFEIEDINKLTEEELKKLYRALCFKTHPDAHPNEDKDEYQQLFIQVQQAYDILFEYITNRQNDTNYSKLNGFNYESYQYRHQQEINRKIEKEKILTDIIVRAYYAAKPELDQINDKYLDILLSIPSDIHKHKIRGRTVLGGFRNIQEALEQKSKEEAKILEKYTRQYIHDFIEEYGLDIDDRYFRYDGLDFLEDINWYDKYMEKKQQESNQLARRTR